MFLEEEMGIDSELELSGGGLVTSHGGWPESAVDAQTGIEGAG
jgi:putative transposase